MKPSMDYCYLPALLSLSFVDFYTKKNCFFEEQDT